MTPLVLASASPRRRQLLEMLGIPVEVRPSSVPEERRPGEAPRDYALRLAHDKAQAVSGRARAGRGYHRGAGGRAAGKAGGRGRRGADAAAVCRGGPTR